MLLTMPPNQRGQPFIRITELDKSGQIFGDAVWDGIIFNDSATDKIYPGSSYRHRSQGLDPPPEKSGPTDLLHLAAVYARDNTITVYRNGKILGHSFRPQHAGKDSDLVTYSKGRSAIVIGGGNMRFDVEEARFYTRALSAEEIAASYRTFKK